MLMCDKKFKEWANGRYKDEQSYNTAWIAWRACWIQNENQLNVADDTINTLLSTIEELKEEIQCLESSISDMHINGS